MMRQKQFCHLKVTARTATLRLAEELFSTFERNSKGKIYLENQNIHVNSNITWPITDSGNVKQIKKQPH